MFRVAPSLDREVFFCRERLDRPIVRITAMVRVSTPRRAPHRTVRVLKRIKETYAKRVEIQVFGSSDAELHEAGIELAASRVINLGKLTRLQVAELLRNSDIFVDLSDYQAFGRTGLEAMACGAVPILPIKGGAGEYAASDRNSLLVDTLDEEACEASIQSLVDNDALLATLQRQGLLTASNYSIENTAYSELILFLSLLSHRGFNGSAIK